MKKIITIAITVLVLAITLAFVSAAHMQPKASAGNNSDPTAKRLHTLKIETVGALKDFFNYSTDRIPFVSAHRGGPRAGFPENCIPTFENTLSKTWALLEIDPHYTKDSAIVLMHDATLDRTSNGHGKVSDYTLAEIRKLKLKDTEGNLTSFKIPTLDEALEWSKGKTILVLDQKDVPIDVRVRKIQEHDARKSAIVIAYSTDDIKRCYELDKDIMMEVMMADSSAAVKFEATGVPWKNVVAFVTHTQPKHASIFKYVHDRSAMCIIGSSRTIDKEFAQQPRPAKQVMNIGYQKLVGNGADIIEADLGIEAGEAMMAIMPANSSKAKYFK